MSRRVETGHAQTRPTCAGSMAATTTGAAITTPKAAISHSAAGEKDSETGAESAREVLAAP